MSRRTLPARLTARRLAVAAVAPLALGTLVACGGDDGGTTAKEPAASSSPSEESSESADAEPTEDTAVAAGEEIEPEEFMDIFEAAFDEATTAHVTMDMSSAAGSIEAEGDADYTTTPPDMTLEMGGAALQGQTMDMRLVDGVMYMKMPAMGEKFVKLDLNDPNNPLGPGLTNQLDPRGMFDSFGDSLDEVVYQGEEDVDGETTDAYAVTVDAETVLKSQGQEIPPGIEIPEQITYVMNFDEDGRYRRMVVEMGEALGDVTMDFTDWGADVTIEAPPKNQVTDFPGGGTAAG
ncbi:LppX_LprAFG lipoprotein [Nocardioides dongkuii]|uniref:LppX_LprAFG lipoprotein n=1 Tax=Nocardioides dongkuii TaxID=2760089 RepID=UPI0015FCA421|nr:LppX_LprAFG lipoprotein [Nocardioides dongkuii]